MVISTQITLPLSIDKFRQIAAWRVEVNRHCTPSSLFNTGPLIDGPIDFFHPTTVDFHGSLEHYHQALDDDFDADRWTFVFEGDGRVQALPHPTRNPLVTADLDLLQDEYISVLQSWNEFEVEKWRAEKMFRAAETPDNIQRVFTADYAVESASRAARYIEMHAKQHGVQCNFEALFFRIYQPPGFGSYFLDDCWNDTPLSVQTPPVYSQFTPPMPCTPTWTYLPPAMPSRMIEV